MPPQRALPDPVPVPSPLNGQLQKVSESLVSTTTRTTDTLRPPPERLRLIHPTHHNPDHAGQHTHPTPPPGTDTTTPATTPPDGATDTNANSSAGKSGKDSQASRLVALALELFTLVQSSDGRLYAVENGGPNVVIPLKGDKGLRQRLAREYYTRTETTPGGSALSDALTVIEGRASAEPETPIGLRVAPWRTGFVLDLGEPSGRVVIVQPGHWHLVASSPVLFRRSKLTGPLPVPVPPGTGTLAGLRRLLNVDDAAFRLIVAWLVAALWPDIPHPILVLLGEQGTAKSTAARFAVRMVNPSTAPLTTPPKDIEQWAVTAAASWTVALDNLSTIPGWFSDSLCKAVTGDGVITRTLYADDDVTVKTFRRVIVLTAIDAGALAGDLAERMIPIELQTIPKTARRPEADIEADFTTTYPTALGALLDLAAAVLRHPPRRPPDRTTPHGRLRPHPGRPRHRHRVDHPDRLHSPAPARANTAVLDADPFATAILALINGQAVGWEGTAAELLETLTAPATRPGMAHHPPRPVRTPTPHHPRPTNRWPRRPNRPRPRRRSAHPPNPRPPTHQPRPPPDRRRDEMPPPPGRGEGHLLRATLPQPHPNHAEPPTVPAKLREMTVTTVTTVTPTRLTCGNTPNDR